MENATLDYLRLPTYPTGYTTYYRGKSKAKQSKTKQTNNKKQQQQKKAAIVKIKSVYVLTFFICYMQFCFNFALIK